MNSVTILVNSGAAMEKAFKFKTLPGWMCSCLVLIDDVDQLFFFSA